MRTLMAVLSLILVMMISGFAFAAEKFKGETFKGFVKIEEGYEIYVDYVKPKAGQPTVVLLNGLTYNLTHWDRFVTALEKRGVGILRYDMFGMGQTLLKYAPVTEKISYQDQVEDIRDLLKIMKIKGPYNFVGLSYGGGVGFAYALEYPKEVKNLVLMAPYTEPLEQQYNWIMAQIWATRQIFPYNKMSDDDLYDYFLHQIVYATYPQAEPVVLQNPFILESVFRMVQGIRKFRPIDVANQLASKTHLMVGEYDQYIPEKVLNNFWAKVPAKSKASRIVVEGSEHKIPESVPRFAAAWVYEIATGNPALFKGEEFKGFPFKGEASSPKDTIQLNGGKE